MLLYFVPPFASFLSGGMPFFCLTLLFDLEKKTSGKSDNLIFSKSRYFIFETEMICNAKVTILNGNKYAANILTFYFAL